jgi:uncharacterized protein DUF6438/carboxypeptidase family protein
MPLNANRPRCVATAARFILLLSLSGALPRRASPQTCPGIISGIVADPIGAVIPNARVAIRVPQSHQARAVLTDQEGHYEFDNVAPGKYEISFSASGFATRTFAVEVKSGKTIHRSARLNLWLPKTARDCPTHSGRPDFPRNLGSVKITLVRTSCLGSCPEYSLEIHGDGTVIYEGGSFVHVTGRQIYKIAPSKVKKLVKKFYKVDFFSLCGTYSIPSTDLPSTTATFEAERFRKSVCEYGRAGPRALQQLEDEIDRVAETSQFVTGLQKP